MKRGPLAIWAGPESKTGVWVGWVSKNQSASRQEMSIFNCQVPDGKYSILTVGFPTCRHCLRQKCCATDKLISGAVRLIKRHAIDQMLTTTFMYCWITFADTSGYKYISWKWNGLRAARVQPSVPWDVSFGWATSWTADVHRRWSLPLVSKSSASYCYSKVSAAGV